MIGEQVFAATRSDQMQGISSYQPLQLGSGGTFRRKVITVRQGLQPHEIAVADENIHGRVWRVRTIFQVVDSPKST
jgi:hypothetical protein